MFYKSRYGVCVCVCVYRCIHISGLMIHFHVKWVLSMWMPFSPATPAIFAEHKFHLFSLSNAQQVLHLKLSASLIPVLIPRCSNANNFASKITTISRYVSARSHFVLNNHCSVARHLFRFYSFRVCVCFFSVFSCIPTVQFSCTQFSFQLQILKVPWKDRIARKAEKTRTLKHSFTHTPVPRWFCIIFSQKRKRCFGNSDIHTNTSANAHTRDYVEANK